MKKRWIALCCCLALLAGCSAAPGASVQDAQMVVLRVNGEEIYESQIQEVVTLLEETYAEYEITDVPTQEELREEAIEQVARDTAVRQYIKELGLDAISDEEEQTLRTAADSAWNSSLDEYVSNYSIFLNEGDDDNAFRNVAEGIFQTQGYSYDALLAKLEDYCRAQHLYNYLMDGIEIRADEVQEYYDRRVQEDEQTAQDIARYEQTMYLSGKTMLYVPEGYRYITQILLPVDSTLLLAYTSAKSEQDAAEAEREILAQYESVTDEIHSRLSAGAEFAELAEEYAADGTAANYEDGCMVHAQSQFFYEEFLQACMQLEQPGDYSSPFLTPEGIHIVCYQSDVPAGARQLTEEIKLALSSELMDEKVEVQYTALADRLYAQAELQS